MAAPEVLDAIFAEVHGDSVDPGPELGLAAKRPNGLEHLNEDLLRHVLGLVTPAKHAQDEPIHTLFVSLNELVERALVVGDEPLDESLFAFLVVVQKVPTRNEVTTTVDRSARRREGHALATAAGSRGSECGAIRRPRARESPAISRNARRRSFRRSSDPRSSSRPSSADPERPSRS